MKLFSGRINYPTYITGRLILFLIWIGIAFSLISIYNFPLYLDILLFIIVTIPIDVLNSSLDVRRAHDVGIPATWSILGINRYKNIQKNIKKGISYFLQRDEFLNTPYPAGFSTLEFGGIIPSGDFLLQDSYEGENEYGEKPKNGIDILGLFGL